MQIRIQRIHPNAILPAYAHGPGEDAGMDLHAVEDVLLEPGVSRMVPTGLTLEVVRPVGSRVAGGRRVGLTTAGEPAGGAGGFRRSGRKDDRAEARRR